MLPNVPKAKVYARIVLTPMNAKLLHRALGENLGIFESKFGRSRRQTAALTRTRKKMGFVRD